MQLESSVTNDKFDDDYADSADSEYHEIDSKIHRNKRQHSAEIRRRIEEKMEEKWLRDELGDLDNY